MNFLAHLFLSGNNDDLKIGNFIADAVKGTPPESLGSGVIRGIILHRRIDTYTDSHPIVLQSIKRLRERHGKFAGVVVDICYDHFLAKNWKAYSDQELWEYVNSCYALMLKHNQELPERIQQMLPYMVKGNWLYNYRTLDGIDRVFKGMARRTPFDFNMSSAMKDLWMDYQEYEAEFNAYFPQLQHYVQSLLDDPDFNGSVSLS
jgi:acyl carrier protein phosphodiesterase